MFKPMLAATLTNVADVRFPVLASPKLDGVRAIIQNGVVMSRSMKPIPNQHVQALFGSSALDGLDGELIVGSPTAPDCYRTTVSGVMKEEGTPNVVFHVFDYATEPLAVFHRRPRVVEDYATEPLAVFHRRLRYVEQLCPDYVGSVREPVPHTLIVTQQELDAYETHCLERGFEGVMLRDPNGTYKQGRSTLKEGGLLKLKRFSDSEAEIIGFEERMHNTNEKLRDERGYAKRSSAQDGLVPCGTLGALQVRDIVSGVEFSVGTGFDDATRASIWGNRHRMLGALIKYKHFSIGNYDKPRFPTFLGFRAATDM